MSSALIETVDWDASDQREEDASGVVLQDPRFDGAHITDASLYVAGGVLPRMPVVLIVGAGDQDDVHIHIGAGYCRDLVGAIASKLEDRRAGLGRLVLENALKRMTCTEDAGS